MLKRHRFALTGLLICAFSALWAAEREKPADVEVLFNLVNIGPELSDVYCVGADLTPVEVPMPSQRLEVRRVRYYGSPTITFYRPMGEGGFPANLLPIGRATVPKGARLVTFLFIPNPSGKPFPYVVVPLNASLAAFGQDRVKIFNFTKYFVAGKLGEQIFRLKPGAMAECSALEQNGKPNMLVMARSDGELQEIFSSGVFWISADSRYWVFILPNTHNPGKIFYRKFNEHILPLKQPMRFLYRSKTQSGLPEQENGEAPPATQS